MNHKLIASLIIIMIVSACSSPMEKWDDDNRTYTNETYGLSLNLPDEDWQIAVGDSLPDKILFCGVIPEKEICTILCKFDKKIYSPDIWSANENSVLSIIEQITKQHTKVNAIYSVPKIEKTKLNGINVIKFNRNLHLPIDSVDTLSVSYCGVLTISNSKFIGLLNTFPGEKQTYREISETIISGLNIQPSN